MKILYLTNNPVSQSLSEWLRDQPDRDEVIVCQEKLTLAELNAIRPDWVVSYSYRHILGGEVLASRPGRFVNLHIAYLPFNRGADPNVWSFLEDTAKGVTIHLIDEGIDTGAVLAQKEIFFNESGETLGHTYAVLQEELQTLFKACWPDLRAGRLKARAQSGVGSFHYAKQFKAIQEKLLGEEGWAVPLPLLKKRYQNLKD